ncbi:MAG: flagellin [bacterium]
MSSFSINTNINAASIRRRAQNASESLNDRLEKLASGLDINSASDDAAGLAISQKVTSQIRGGSQALKNLQDGISLLQTAEGGTQAIQENLQRIRELSVRASNSATLTDEDQEKIQSEVDQLTEEIDRVAEDTEFNGKNLLNGDISSGTQIQAGADQGDTVSISVGDLSSDSLGVSSLDVTTESGVSDALDSVTGALNQVATERADIGSTVNRLDSSIDSSLIQRENEQAARSQIRDANLAREATERAQSSLLTQAGTSTLAQANDIQGSNALNLL